MVILTTGVWCGRVYSENGKYGRDREKCLTRLGFDLAGIGVRWGVEVEGASKQARNACFSTCLRSCLRMVYFGIARGV